MSRQSDKALRRGLTPDPPPATVVAWGRDYNHWCVLGFAEPAVVFKGPTQTARSVTEAWVALHGFCPNCSADRLPPPPAIVIPGGGERSEAEARNPAAREREAVGSAGA